MFRGSARADTRSVTVELLSRHLVRTVDSIGLPSEAHPVEGRASREDAYTIHVTTSLAQTAERLTELIGGAKVAVVTDTTVMDLYGPTLVRALERAGVEPEIAAIPPGEQHKTLGQACRLLDWLTGTQIGRRDVIVNLGGGVVIDMGGWVASAYMRGVPYVNLPTTLIGQVDAGIGGIGGAWAGEGQGVGASPLVRHVRDRLRVMEEGQRSERRSQHQHLSVGLDQAREWRVRPEAVVERVSLGEPMGTRSHGHDALVRMCALHRTRPRTKPLREAPVARICLGVVGIEPRHLLAVRPAPLGRHLVEPEGDVTPRRHSRNRAVRANRVEHRTNDCLRAADHPAERSHARVDEHDRAFADADRTDAAHELRTPHDPVATRWSLSAHAVLPRRRPHPRRRRGHR